MPGPNFLVADMTRQRTDAEASKKAASYAEGWMKKLDKEARGLSLYNFQVKSIVAGVAKVSFQNPVKKTSHAGEINLTELKTEDVARAIESVPEVATDAAPQILSYTLNDIRFVKVGGRIYVKSDTIGDLTSFEEKEFVEENLEPVKAQIAASVSTYGAQNRMNILFTLPKLSEASAPAEFVPALIPASSVEHFMSEPVVEAVDMSSDLVYKMQMLSENDRASFLKKAEGIKNRASQSVQSTLRSMKVAENINVSVKSDSLSVDQYGKVSGSVSVSATFSHANDMKKIAVDVLVEKDVIVPTPTESIALVISEATGEKALAQASYKSGLVKLASNVNVAPTEPSIAKVANTTLPMAAVAAVVRINKEMLPESSVGDVIDVDGLKYTITSGDEDKLSKEGSGAYWTMAFTPDQTEKVDDKPRT